MKTLKKIYSLVLLSTLLLLAGCSEEYLIETGGATGNGRSLTVTASVPAGGQDEAPEAKAGTRVALAQDGKTIALTWEVGDKIELLFVQGATTVQCEVVLAAADITGEGKKARFDIVLPDEIESGSFDLYGVYGGGGLSESDPTQALLPANAGDATSLGSVQEREDVMLYFSSEGIGADSPDVNVTFQHLGSLFSIELRNSGTATLDNLGEIRLTSDASGWAYNAGTGGNSYDLVTGTFINAGSAGDYLSFTAAQSSLAGGQSMTFWGWYPPLKDVNWPELKVELVSTSNATIAVTSDSKPARTAPTEAGKSFYFYADWDGTALQFSAPGETWYLAERQNFTFPVPAGNEFLPSTGWENLIDEGSDWASTRLSLNKPGGENAPAAVVGDVFIPIDMQQELKFNRIYLRHSSENTYAQLRMWEFDLLGSDDGETFFPLQEGVIVPGATVNFQNVETTVILDKTYMARYIRIVPTNWNKSAGATMQLADLKIGYDEYQEFPPPFQTWYLDERRNFNFEDPDNWPLNSDGTGYGDDWNYLIDEGDDWEDSFISLSKPGRGNAPSASVGDVYIPIDMRQELTFNRIFLRHRSTQTLASLRIWEFDLMGSDNGITYYPLQEGVEVPGASTNGASTVEATINLADTYTARYIKIVPTGWNTTTSNTMQVSDLRIGYDESL